MPETVREYIGNQQALATKSQAWLGHLRHEQQVGKAILIDCNISAIVDCLCCSNLLGICPDQDNIYQCQCLSAPVSSKHEYASAGTLAEES